VQEGGTWRVCVRERYIGRERERECGLGGTGGKGGGRGTTEDTHTMKKEHGVAIKID